MVLAVGVHRLGVTSPGASLQNLASHARCRRLLFSFANLPNPNPAENDIRTLVESNIKERTAKNVFAGEVNPGQEHSSENGCSHGGSSSDVIELTADNVEAEMLEYADPWLVEFFGPWYGHCKVLDPVSGFDVSIGFLRLCNAYFSHSPRT